MIHAQFFLWQHLSNNNLKPVQQQLQRCNKCWKVVARPNPQLLGQLPADCVTPGKTFASVGVDYAGPMLIKSGPVCKPVFKKAYVTVIVCFATKAVHLELVSNLTTLAFIATLCKFIGCRGIPRKFGAITAQTSSVPSRK